MRFTQGWRKRGALLWAGLIILVPVSAGWSLSRLADYSQTRQAAGLHLEKLAADVNGTAELLGWALLLHLPGAAAEPTLRVDQAGVVTDIANLRTDSAAGVEGLTEVERATTSFMALAAGAASVLDAGGFDPTSSAQVEGARQAQTQHDDLIALIHTRIATATHAAANAEWFQVAGTWLVVVVMTTILIAGLYEVTRRRRRTAVAKAQQATVEESERTYRLLFDRNPLPMFTLDRQSLRFVAVNDAAIASYGYSRDEFLSMMAVDLLPEEDRAPFLSRGIPSIPNLTATSRRHLLKSGRVIDVDVVADQLEVGAHSILLVAAQDVTAQRDLVQQLKYQALHDELTVLPNRALFVDRLEHALRRRSLRRLAVMLLDVDNFKAVNDSYGHAAGDILLMELAGRIQSCIRSEDTVARLGGDEFALVIEDGHEMATEIARRVLDAFDEPFVVPGAAGISVSASIGIAIAEEGQGISELLRNADVAMYAAKGNGKNRSVTFAQVMHREVMRRTTIETGLRRAVRTPEEHFEVVYQPVYATVGKQLAGFEALLRWEHPEVGPISPAEFIPVAEATGVIVSLGRWVLEQACHQAMEFQKASGRIGDLRMSVNLSPVQFSRPGLVADVQGALKASGLGPACLVLEITESALVMEMSEMLRVLAELKLLGVMVAVDDFGTGQSSLARLAQYPVDLLKIDRSFFGDGSNASRLRLLQGTVDLARTLGLWVVAEGVETEQQAVMLPCMSGVFVQGFLYSRPLKVDAVHALLDAHATA
jgi:Amt family ammonium transporter